VDRGDAGAEGETAVEGIADCGAVAVGRDEVRKGAAGRARRRQREEEEALFLRLIERRLLMTHI
jgi:hypothetical protein